MLQGLANRYRLGIVSNTNDTEMVPRLVLDHFRPELFEHIVLSVDHGVRKPHPSIYRAALDLFAVAPARTIFVGDSYEADYQGPIAVGMDALLIDPDEMHPVPSSHRLITVRDLAEHI
jgi:putative hydrolase of the HAD superfamily